MLQVVKPKRRVCLCDKPIHVVRKNLSGEQKGNTKIMTCLSCDAEWKRVEA